MIHRWKGTLLSCGCPDYFTEKGLDAEASYSDQPLPLLSVLVWCWRLPWPYHGLACNGTMDILCPKEFMQLIHSATLIVRVEGKHPQLEVSFAAKTRAIHFSQRPLSVLMLQQLLSTGKNRQSFNSCIDLDSFLINWNSPCSMERDEFVGPKYIDSRNSPWFSWSR